MLGEDMAQLISRALERHGFATDPRVLSIGSAPIVSVDFHPPGMLLYGELDTGRGFAYNENLFVDPRQRQLGIGQRLVAAYEEICREAGVTILINDNRNTGFWKRLGYRRLGPLRQIHLARRLGIRFQRESLYKRL
jgi:GNAT superfamily N-acetyltransferase